MNPEHPNPAHPSPEQPSPEQPSRRRAILLSLGLGAALLVAAGASVLLGAWAGTPVAAASPRASATPTALPSPTPQPTATPAPTPKPFDQEMLRSRYTVLVIGDDANDKRDLRGHASRTDTIMVVSLSPRQKRVTMLSVPRDTVDVPMANGLTYTGKVNGLAYALGYDALVGAVETLLQIDIHGYVKVDMDNFVELVDAVGGVKVNNQYGLADAHLHFALGPGIQRLDGEAALDYTRTRVDSDYARAARQQQVLLALVRKYVNPSVRWNLDNLLLTLDSLRTDIDLADLPTLLEMARRARKAEVVGTVLQPPRFSVYAGIEPNSARGWVMIPNVAEMRAYAQSVMGD